MAETILSNEEYKKKQIEINQEQQQQKLHEDKHKK